MGSVLIKGGFVVDGSGAPGEKKDVLFKDRKIIAVGHLPAQQADLVIDATGLTVAPGFIDVNTDSDHYLSLFTDPAQQDFLLQGVTTIIGGHCGSSLAPLIKGSLESIRKWGDINAINVDWHTMGEFLEVLAGRRLGVNFGTLVGHATIRRGLVGEELRDLTTAELEVMREFVIQAFKDGALGVSTGLAYNHARNASYPEIVMLATLAEKFGRVYSTHLRHEHQNIVAAVSEAVSIASESKAKTVISHLRALKDFEEQFKEVRALIERAPANLRFDAYPFDYSIVPIYTLLPEWAQQGSLEHMQQLIADPQNKEQLIDAFKRIKGEEIVIARAPGFDYLVGKNLAEYSANRELAVPQAFYELLRELKLRAVCFRKNVAYEPTLDALMTDRAFVASNSPSLLAGKSVIENERAAKTFSKFLAIALERKVPLEAAIRKITALPAEFYGLTGRGYLREGYVADVVVLRGSSAVQVFVGGACAVLEGVMQGSLNGEVIRAR